MFENDKELKKAIKDVKDLKEKMAPKKDEKDEPSEEIKYFDKQLDLIRNMESEDKEIEEPENYEVRF